MFVGTYKCCMKINSSALANGQSFENICIKCNLKLPRILTANKSFLNGYRQ